MKTRIITGAILVVAIVLTIWVLPLLVGAVLVGIMGALAAYELLISAGYVRHKRLLIYCGVMAFLTSLWSYLGAEPAWGTLGVLLFTGILFGEMMHNHVKVRFERICICLAAGLLIPYLLTALVRIHGTYLGRYTIVIPFLLACLPDTGAYFVGIRFGKRKLAPVISPNKTMEGALGGLAVGIGCMLLYAVIMDLAFDKVVSYPLALLYGFVGVGTEIFGDLMFSALKRQAGIKDYGTLFPGHGGVLDRFDSLVTVAPLVEVLLIILPVVK